MVSKKNFIAFVNNFKQQINSLEYFQDFYLNFGGNNLVIANNIRLDDSIIGDPTILIQLYEPLPSEFDLKSQVWAVEQLSTPQAYQVQFPTVPFTIQDFRYISGPNFNLNLQAEAGSTSQEFSLDSLLTSNVTLI